MNGLTVASTLAHQGGWDEALFVVGPIAVVAALLWLAKRRAARAATRSRSTSSPE